MNVMGGPKKNLNLNTAISYSKKKKWRDHDIFHYRGEIKFIGRETDMKECKECHRILPLTAYTAATMRGDGAYYLQNGCRECHTILYKEQRDTRKKAPPKPERCASCHKKVEKLQVDHIHGSTIFRGWLCKHCNMGIGALGDNLEGVLQAAVFLENNENKIIKTLHKVFNKIFARTK